MENSGPFQSLLPESRKGIDGVRRCNPRGSTSGQYDNQGQF
jgi:hypothetical protein